MKTGFKKQIDFFYNILFKPLNNVRKPLSLNLEITNKCNCNCIMCNRENIVHFKTLSYDEFLRIVESVNPQFISMHGYGEPLLNPDLFRMIKYVSDRKIKNTITSNAVLLNKNNLQKLNDCGLDLLKISIDTLNKNNFYKIRGIENFDTVIENIKNARSYNYKFDIRLSFTVLHFNYYEMSEFINFAADSGFDKVYFQPLLFYNSILKKRDYGNIDKTDFLKHILKAYNVSVKKNINTNLKSFINDFENVYFQYKKHSLISPEKKCLKPWATVYVSVDGTVKPCDCLGLTDINMGNIFEKSFNEIWNDTEYKNFRTSVKKCVYDNPVCSDCNVYSIYDWMKYRFFVKKYAY